MISTKTSWWISESQLLESWSWPQSCLSHSEGTDFWSPLPLRPSVSLCQIGPTYSTSVVDPPNLLRRLADSARLPRQHWCACRLWPRKDPKPQATHGYPIPIPLGYWLIYVDRWCLRRLCEDGRSSSATQNLCLDWKKTISQLKKAPLHATLLDCTPNFQDQ